MFEPIWICILAAGQSTRMGSPKQLLQIRGESLIRLVAKKALTVDGVKVAIVGTDEPVMKEQCADLAVEWIANKQSNQGMSTSIRAGIQYAAACKASAVMMLLGDQPDIEPDVIGRLADTYRRTIGAIVQARYSGRPGHPVLFDQALFPELMQLEGDIGAKNIIRRHHTAVQFVEVASEMPLDLDTPKEYRDYLRSIPT